MTHCCWMMEYMNVSLKSLYIYTSNSITGSGLTAGSINIIPFLKSALSNFSPALDGLSAKHANSPTYADSTATLFMCIDLIVTGLNAKL